MADAGPCDGWQQVSAYEAGAGFEAGAGAGAGAGPGPELLRCAEGLSCLPAFGGRKGCEGKANCRSPRRRTNSCGACTNIYSAFLM